MVVVFVCVYKAGSFPREGTGWGLSLGAPQGPAGCWRGQWAPAPGTPLPLALSTGFASWSPGRVCSRTNSSWPRPPPCTPAGRGPSRGLTRSGPVLVRPVHPSALGADASSGQSVSPRPLGAQRQVQGPASSHPVPRPWLPKHGKCICPGSGRGRRWAFPPPPLASLARLMEGPLREGMWRRVGPSEGSARGAGWTPHVVFGACRGRGGKGGGERGAGGQGREHTSGKGGMNLLVFQSRAGFASRPCSRCSFKSSQSGEAAGHRLPFKVGLAPPSFWRCTRGVWLPGFRKLHNPGLCPAAPSPTLARPLLQGPSPHLPGSS